MTAPILPDEFGETARSGPYLGPSTGDTIDAPEVLRDAAGRQATAELPSYTGPVTGQQETAPGDWRNADEEWLDRVIGEWREQQEPATPPAATPRAATPSRRKARRRVVVTAVAAAAIAAMVCAVPQGRHLAGAGLGWLAHFRAVRVLVYAVWLVPLAELVMLLSGHWYYRRRFRRAPGKFRLLIVQITTTGKEQARVNEIIASLRSYALPMEHQIWVVTEPGEDHHYPQADRLLVVPADFTARSERKARAMEYARRIRGADGLDQAWVKLLYNDDDVLPTRGYVMTAFEADYDVCEGITAPRTEYATLPVGHVIASHVDDVRARQCLIYCSVFQGILGKPLYVHGEGLTATGEAERIVTWNYPVFASEDLTFGQNAAKLGLRWGWFHECVELTSPWTLKDFFTQRKRWLWGNIHAISHRDVLPGTRAAAISSKYVADSAIFLLSTTGVVMRLTGALPPSSAVYGAAKLAILTWLCVFFAVGWIGASGSVDRRNNDSRLLAALMAVVFSPLSCLITAAGLIWPLIAGNPRTFEVIRKTRNS